MRLDLLLAFLLALAPASPSAVTLTAGRTTATVAAAEEGTLLSIPDVVAALGGSARSQPGASLAVEIAGHRIVCADGVATVAFDDRVVMLAHPTREFSGILYAPWEFFEKTVLQAAGLSGEYDRAGGRIRARSVAVPASVLDVALVHLNQTTQVVFRESAATPFEARLEADTYFVRFKSPITVPFAEKSFDDPFVARIHFQATTAAIRLTGTGLTATSYALRSPDRIVVEVSPARPAGAPPPVALPAPPPPQALARTVVIDPGHGGDETGAVGPGGLVEKNVTLDIARRLAAVLARGGSIRPVLTRTSDTLVALDERAAIANHEKAAVFISIHANSSRAPGAQGSETYYLSLEASDKLAAAVAKEENAAGAGAAGPAAGSPELDFILWDMAQSAHLNESAALAESIQNELNLLLHTENRGIKQAPFRVLVGAAMPAVLVETAFISNPDEARELASPDFRQSVADAIARAVTAYLAAHPAAPPPPS